MLELPHSLPIYRIGRRAATIGRNKGSPPAGAALFLALTAPGRSAILTMRRPREYLQSGV